MAIKRCLKCGADIPDEAEFCPSCGAPKGAKAVTQQPAKAQPAAQQPVAQQAVYQQQQPMQSSNPMSMQKVSPLAGIFDMVYSKTLIIGLTAIGILLAWIATMIGIFSSENGDIAQALLSTGFALIGLQLIAGGIWNNRIIPLARLGMIFIGGSILVAGLSVASAVISSAFSSIPTLG